MDRGSLQEQLGLSVGGLELWLWMYVYGNSWRNFPCRFLMSTWLVSTTCWLKNIERGGVGG